MTTKIYTNPLGWHEGESQIHKLLRVPEYDNPTSFGLGYSATLLVHLSSLLAVGTLDDEGRPWTTVIGGESGFARSMGNSVIGVKTNVGPKYDPVFEALLSEGARGKIISGLGIHLDTRERVKLSGRFLGGGLFNTTDPERDMLRDVDAAELQMAFAVEQSLTNCPKYLNRKSLLPIIPQPILLSDSLPLCPAAIALLSKADLFFISTSHEGTSMGTNHRGGTPGFVRVASTHTNSTTLIYPEYSGNRLYQTLGNLYTTPRAGLVFPDFDTGDVLYVTGTTEIAYGKEAADTLPRSNLLVKIHLTAVRYVQRGLAFRAATAAESGSDVGGEPSPYNPPVRYLASERDTAAAAGADAGSSLSATLVSKTILTSTIARLRFRIADPDSSSTTSRATAAGTTTTKKEKRRPRWTAGQYVALDFSEELDNGYRHSNDDDPRSLNDDFIRTFTVSSSPHSSHPTPGTTITTSTPSEAEEQCFDITFRNVGTATDFLHRQHLRAGLTLPLRGFGGSFRICQPSSSSSSSSSPSSTPSSKIEKNEIVPFIAGGIGITPFLAQLPELDLSRLKVYWTLKRADVGLVRDTLERCPGLASRTELFVSGIIAPVEDHGDLDDGEEGSLLSALETQGVIVHRRRIKREDLDLDLGVVRRGEEEGKEEWYICTAPPLRKELLSWLEGKKCVFEDFDY